MARRRRRPFLFNYGLSDARKEIKQANNEFTNWISSLSERANLSLNKLEDNKVWLTFMHVMGAKKDYVIELTEKQLEGFKDLGKVKGLPKVLLSVPYGAALFSEKFDKYKKENSEQPYAKACCDTAVELLIDNKFPSIPFPLGSTALFNSALGYISENCSTISKKLHEEYDKNYEKYTAEELEQKAEAIAITWLVGTYSDCTTAVKDFFKLLAHRALDSSSKEIKSSEVNNSSKESHSFDQKENSSKINESKPTQKPIHDPTFDSEGGGKTNRLEESEHRINSSRGVFPNLDLEFKTFLEATKDNEVMSAVVQKEMMKMREWKASGQVLDSFQFNLEVAKNCLEALDDKQLSSEERSKWTMEIGLLLKNTIKKQEKQLNGLSEAMELKESEKGKNFLGLFENFSKQIHFAHREMGNQLNMISQNVNESKEVILNMQDCVNSLQEGVCDIKADTSDIKFVTDQLFSQMMDVSISGFSKSKEINKIYEELENLKKETPDDKRGISRKKFELDKAIATEQNRRIQFDYTLEVCQGGLGLIGSLAGRWGYTKMANKINTGGNAAYTLIKSIGGIAGYGTAAASGGVLLPLIGAAGAFLTLWDVCFAGDEESKDPSQIILDGIRQLSGQIDELRNSMFHCFQVIEGENQKRHIQLNKRFDRLEFMLSVYHREIMQQFSQLHKKEDLIQESCEEMKTLISQLENRMKEGFQLVLEDNYKIAKQTVLTFHQNYLFPKYKLGETGKLHEYWITFYHFALNRSKESLYVGNELESVDILSIQKALINSKPEEKIKVLVQYAATLGVKKRDLINPFIWAEGVTTLTEYGYATPEFELKENHHKQVNELIVAGMDFEQFVCDIKTNEKLFETIINGYGEAWKALLDEVMHLVLDDFGGGNGTDSENFDRLLNKVHSLHPLRVKEVQQKQKVDGIDKKIIEFKECSVREIYKELCREKNEPEDSLDSDSDIEMEDAKRSLLEQEKKYEEQEWNRLDKEAKSREDDLKKQKGYEYRGIMDYFEQVLDVKQRTMLNQKIQKALESGHLKEVVQSLDGYYQLLNAYLSFAFKKDAIGDYKLKHWLKSLWNRKRLTNYVQKYVSSNSKDFIFKHIVENQKFAEKIVQFKDYLFEEKIDPAIRAGENKTLKSDYPLVEDVIENLEQFKLLMFKKPTRLKKVPKNESESDFRFTGYSTSNFKKRKFDEIDSSDSESEQLNNKQKTSENTFSGNTKSNKNTLDKNDLNWPKTEIGWLVDYNLRVVGNSLVGKHSSIRYTPAALSLGNQSEQGLLMFNLKNWANDEKSETVFAIALNPNDKSSLGGVHWSYLLCIKDLKDKNKYICFLIDSKSTCYKSSTVEDIVKKSLGKCEFKGVSLAVQLDDYNCGVWVLAMLEETVKWIAKQKEHNMDGNAIVNHLIEEMGKLKKDGIGLKRKEFKNKFFETVKNE